MNDEYKVIPFAEVKVGQEFEDADNLSIFTDSPWIKISETSYSVMNKVMWDSKTHPKVNCLVRIADCDELEGCTWTYKEHAWESACGVTYTFTEERDSLELNGFTFCHKCGEKIVEAK